MQHGTEGVSHQIQISAETVRVDLARENIPWRAPLITDGLKYACASFFKCFEHAKRSQTGLAHFEHDERLAQCSFTL